MWTNFAENMVVQKKMHSKMLRLRKDFGCIQRCELEIKLNTIEDVSDFVAICSKYHGCDIDVVQNRYTVDAKSMLGIFSLNLLKPIKVFIDSNKKDLKISFFNNIRKWNVNVED